MANKTASKSKKEVGFLGKTYLLAYNGAQVAGWSYILYLMGQYYTADPKPQQSLWEIVRTALIIFQNAAVLEVFHAIFGLVSSNAMVTLFQVASRVMVVCGVLIGVEGASDSQGLHFLLFAWTVTEIIRYSFYAMGILGVSIYPIVWCRYTFFIALYPIGVTGELLCLWAASQLVGASKQWTLTFPNSWNATFNYQYFLVIVMALYVPLFPQMYLHMFGQRKKVLGGGASKKKN
ncbi:very-long-chain (3R)-3-hydroxyacyl-CoA dehydratase hpo-8 isoform X1 [Cloeon dipterum]|uniref:very-long-chain (3R)-3-hydroxyacyl-CoA dehydratase hpo-8 isoform X1 n=2 Tax=Cloeon dipterum TaxID=197152 RepID=UPI0032205E52